MPNQEDLIKVYDYIYSQGGVRNPDKKATIMAPYGSHASRDKMFIDWISQNVKMGARILDASCGRGHLALSLHKLGYEVEATEVSQWLIDNELKQLPFPTHLLRYDQLYQLPEKSFDVVCSNDVLEHLISKEVVRGAVDNLFRLSRSAVCISIGRGVFADRYPRSLAISNDCEIIGKGKLKRRVAFNLHTFRASRTWWKRVLGPRFQKRCLHYTAPRGNIFIFGFLNDV